MNPSALDAGRYGGDEVAIGDWIDCGSTTVTAEAILRFAELTGDRFEIHMDDAAAQRHGFARQVAHGLLVLSLVDGLKNNAPAQFKARASKGWDWKFKAPVLAGDRLFAKLTVSGKKASRSPDQMTLALEFEVHNQENVLVQAGRNALLVYR
ncbi:MAG: MaoC family dehydratase [Rhodobacteraceae bacterium]|nr:MaoC family dehydratase [Paracoccaceae bacterium]